MASQKRKHTNHYFRRTGKRKKKKEKKLVCVVHFQGSAGQSFVDLFNCQGSKNRLEKLQDICKWRPMKLADSPNRMEDSFNQMPEKLKPEHG